MRSRLWAARIGFVGMGCVMTLLTQQAMTQEKIQPPRILQRKPVEGELPQVRPAQIGVINDIRTVARGADWIHQFRAALPKYGHRNWIVVADAAYPSQTSPGITTVYTDAEHLEVLQFVLEHLAKSKHVRPVVYLDEELAAVPESDAPGIELLRRGMNDALAKFPPQSLPHEAIIQRLDEAGKQFHILILKTKLTVPYTSVFLQLDCGYWSPEAEQRLRKTLQAGK